MRNYEPTKQFPPEAVYQLHDPDSGLEGTIVLHSTALGPAAGGCRLWTYDGRALMTHDAMRLAQGMSMKNAMAGLPLGGGKCVINRPRGEFDRERLFAALGKAVRNLHGNYVTAEDVGTGVGDMETVRRSTRHVAGLPAEAGRPGGDPSPWTAKGVFTAMQHAVRRKMDCDLEGLTVAVQGLGHVGSALCGLLHEAGAKLVVAETRSDLAARVACRYGAYLAAPEAVLEVECDVLAPCALGAVLNRKSVPKVRAKVVCGAANNVLETAEDGDLLAERGVLYAPDYVVNSGGIINVCGEYLGWEPQVVEQRVGETGARLDDVFDFAERNTLPSHRAADEMALAKIAGAACKTSVAA